VLLVVRSQHAAGVNARAQRSHPRSLHQLRRRSGWLEPDDWRCSPAWCCWQRVWQIIDKPAIYHVASLLIAGGALGAFLSTDLFFIYGFHELALIPTLLMIAVHGHGDATNRRAIAWKITVYLGAGSLVLLAGLAALVLNFSGSNGLTFDLNALMETAKTAPLAADTQAWLFFVLLVGFGTLVSLFPFHSWAAPAYAAAPTPVAMLHSGVLKKFGLYGLIKIALPPAAVGCQG